MNKLLFSRPYLLVLTFWTGVLILSIEIFAFRSMALIVSSSIIITSIVIALVIIALSIGYYLSILVPKERRQKIIIKSLLIIVFTVPLMALIAPLITGILGPFIYNQDHMIAMVVGGLIAMLLLTLPLPLCVGFVSPLLFSLLRKHYNSDQETAARSFIASGFGSLFGSIVPNLILIPFIGLVHGYLLISAVTALLMYKLVSLQKYLIILVLLVVYSLIISYLSKLTEYHDYLAIEETPYQSIFVWQDQETDVITMSFNARIGSQSYLDDKLTLRSRSFFDNILLFMLKDYPAAKNVLMLGSAGSTVSTLANLFLGDKIDLTFTNVDIDPATHQLAKKWFKADYPNIRFVAEDARLFIRKDRDKYDLVVLDVYTNELFIPATLYTSEFFQLVRQRMKDDALLVMNVNAKNVDSPIIRAGLGTLGTAFAHVYATVGVNEGVAFAPVLISASNQKIDFQKLAANNEVGLLKNEFEKMPSLTQEVDAKSMPYLKDDFAMVEYLSIATLIQ